MHCFSILVIVQVDFTILPQLFCCHLESPKPCCFKNDSHYTCLHSWWMECRGQLELVWYMILFCTLDCLQNSYLILDSLSWIHVHHIWVGRTSDAALWQEQLHQTCSILLPLDLPVMHFEQSHDHNQLVPLLVLSNLLHEVVEYCRVHSYQNRVVHLLSNSTTFAVS